MVVSFYIGLILDPEPGKFFPISHPDFVTQAVERVRAGGCDGEAGRDKAPLAATPPGTAMTLPGSPLSLQSTHKDSFVPKEKVRTPVLAVTASA